MRASQLDAARLDNELTAMLREQFMRIFSLFQPARAYGVVTTPCVQGSGSTACCRRAVPHRSDAAGAQRVISALQPELTLVLDYLVQARQRHA